MALKSQKELYQLFINALQDYSPGLTDIEEGSIIDSLGGVLSFAGAEINKGILDEFRKTFFDHANGPEITGNEDELQTLAVDHYGDDFSRPAPSKAIGTVTFSRATTGAGDIVIPAGTIVKTAPNANGQTQRFKTIASVTITGLSVNASVEALVAGTDGNAAANACNSVESSLLDTSIVVTNGLAFTGGAETQNDSKYRETIRRLISALRGATLAAIKAKALTVAGVVTATGIEIDLAVVEYDIATGTKKIGATYFRIPYATLYIADANGTADAALVAAVVAALENVRAGGVKVNVVGATALPINWTASITLNPGGPNYAELSASAQKIKDSMTDYLNGLPVGTGFVKATANAAILALWGSGGTNDLTAFTTSIPAGDVAATSVQKIIAGTMGIA